MNEEISILHNRQTKNETGTGFANPSYIPSKGEMEVWTMCMKILPNWFALSKSRRPNVASLIYNSIKLRFQGRLVFELPAEEILVYDNGRPFRPFRKAVVSCNSVNSRLPVLFKVQFRFRNLPFWLNKLLSWIPVPLITAQPGFISKTWYGKTDSGEFMGIYEFSSVNAANAYWESLPLKLMKWRAATDSLHAEIITFSAYQGRYVRQSLTD